ncbi:hypothetical protein HY969_03100 [Candidatus Kaiserbacteria bacterium]|nr:hypothetical protein [Candidatus Kaiserbacteria bacterium]
MTIDVPRPRKSVIERVGKARVDSADEISDAIGKQVQRMIDLVGPADANRLLTLPDMEREQDPVFKRAVKQYEILVQEMGNNALRFCMIFLPFILEHEFPRSKPAADIAREYLATLSSKRIRPSINIMAKHTNIFLAHDRRGIESLVTALMSKHLQNTWKTTKRMLREFKLTEDELKRVEVDLQSLFQDYQRGAQARRLQIDMATAQLQRLGFVYSEDRAEDCVIAMMRSSDAKNFLESLAEHGWTADIEQLLMPVFRQLFSGNQDIRSSVMTQLADTGIDPELVDAYVTKFGNQPSREFQIKYGTGNTAQVVERFMRKIENVIFQVTKRELRRDFSVKTQIARTISSTK